MVETDGEDVDGWGRIMDEFRRVLTVLTRLVIADSMEETRCLIEDVGRCCLGGGLLGGGGGIV